MGPRMIAGLSGERINELWLHAKHHLGLVVSFWLKRLRKECLACAIKIRVLGGLVKVVPRRAFAAIVGRHGGDKYSKGFSSWDHLVTLVFGQLGGLSSLREVETVWNAQAAHHYHLGSGPIRRSTLSDANRRRPSAIFAEVFAQLSAMASCALPRHGKEVLRLIDATPIPLTSVHKWAAWNGRTRGLKTHVIYDPDADRPVHVMPTERSCVHRYCLAKRGKWRRRP
jgi:hypothetical protein